MKMRIQVRSFDAMCLMVAAGLGIAALPDAAATLHILSMGLSKIGLSEDWAERTLVICARDLSELPKPVRLLVSHLTRAASEDVANTMP